MADTIGRARVTVLSFALRAGFFVVLCGLALTKNPITICLLGVAVSVLWSISYTLYTGSFTAWCVDRLAEDAPSTSCAWLLSRFQSHFLAATAVGAAVGIMCYIHALPIIAYCFMALLSLLAMAFCLMWMNEPRLLNFVTAERRHFKSIAYRATEILKRGVCVCIQSPILLWLSLTFGCYMALLNLVMFLWPVYFKEHISLEKFGPTWIALALLMVSLRALGARVLVYLSDRWEKKSDTVAHVQGFRNIQIVTAVIAVISVYALGWAVMNKWDVLWVTAATVCVVCGGYGFIVTSYETLVNVYIPRAHAQERATIASAGSMIRSLIAMLMAIPAGGTNIENSPMYWTLPATLLLLSTLGVYFSTKTEKLTPKVTAMSEYELLALEGVCPNYYGNHVDLLR